MTERKLQGRHISILMALQEDPMTSVSDLVKRSGLSQTTVYQDLKWLSGDHPESKFRYFRVVPDFDENALGLETVDVVIEVSAFSQYAPLERTLDNHPYTKYRIRIHGSTNGLFVQFRVPHGTSRYVTELLKELRSRERLRDFRILPTQNTESIYTVSSLKNWNLETFSWSFDVDAWASTKAKRVRFSPIRRDPPRLSLLKELDIRVMCHLTRGSRRKQRQIIDALAQEGVTISSQDFSRRLRAINDNFIKGYRLYIDPDAFDLWSNILVTAHVTKRFSEELRGRLRTSSFPFRSTLKLNDEFLLWFIRLPPGHVSELVNYLHSVTSGTEVNLADYRRSEVYCLWHKAFNEERHQWRQDRSFLMEGVS
ncbi:MAG: hypothetical protein ACP6KW_11180 [Candidatus Thorarchaeota archaeon]